MGGLAEDHLDDSPAKVWARRVTLGLIGIATVAGIAYGVRSLGEGASAPKRQVAKISILPDTPPPPPPPKREEKPPEPPKNEEKLVKVEQPKPAEAPPAPSQQLKMEGPAGDAAGGIAAGSVSNENVSGPVSLAPAGASAPQRLAGLNRAAFSAYQLELQALIQETLATKPELKRRDYRLPAFVRLDEQFKVQTVALAGSSGNDDIDRQIVEAVRAALGQRPPPAGLPFRDFTVRVSNRLLN